jgi:NADPH-dependent 2,4-dienoyl-CoA reductase/sulfur reductase-like enzyme
LSSKLKYSDSQGKILQNDIAIIEPSHNHFYQPLWTMVGAGMCKADDSKGNTGDILPANAHWIQDAVKSFQPEENSVTLRSGKKVRYDMLVVASGLQINWSKIPGLTEALEDASCPVVSIYNYSYADKTNNVLSGLKSGQVIFTLPVGGIKCGGAPQKIMWAWESKWADSGVRNNINVTYA